jgi:hypothetical protein
VQSEPGFWQAGSQNKVKRLGLKHHKMYGVAAYSLSRFFHFFHLFLLAKRTHGT